MEKIDLFKQFKAEYAQPKKPTLIELSPAQYMTIDGMGAPGGEDFETAIGALYGMAYTVKMTRKAAGKGDYTVCKLEAQWWSDSKEKDLSKVPQDKWLWKMMIRTPECVTEADLASAREALTGRGKGQGVDRVVLETIEQGRCVQMLHVGPYDQEGQTIAVMLEFAGENDLTPHGRHHEVYISDPRRVPAERLKTILRMPVA